MRPASQQHINRNAAAMRPRKPSRNDRNWIVGWSLWLRHCNDSGTGSVPDDFPDKTLVRWVQRQSEDYSRWKNGNSSFLGEDGFRMMERMGFTWNPHDDSSDNDSAAETLVSDSPTQSTNYSADLGRRRILRSASKREAAVIEDSVDDEDEQIPKPVESVARSTKPTRISKVGTKGENFQESKPDGKEGDVGGDDSSDTDVAQSTSLPNARRSTRLDRIWDAHFDDYVRSMKESDDDNDEVYSGEKHDALLKWIGEQRAEYNKYLEGEESKLSVWQFEKLQEVSFDSKSVTSRDMHDDFEPRFQEMVEYVGDGGNVDAVHHRSPRLGRWVKEIREQYEEFVNARPNVLTRERVELLQALGILIARDTTYSQKIWYAHFSNKAKNAKAKAKNLPSQSKEASQAKKVPASNKSKQNAKAKDTKPKNRGHVKSERDDRKPESRTTRNSPGKRRNQSSLDESPRSRLYGTKARMLDKGDTKKQALQRRRTRSSQRQQSPADDQKEDSCDSDEEELNGKKPSPVARRTRAYRGSAESDASDVQCGDSGGEESSDRPVGVRSQGTMKRGGSRKSKKTPERNTNRVSISDTDDLGYENSDADDDDDNCSFSSQSPARVLYFQTRQERPRRFGPGSGQADAAYGSDSSDVYLDGSDNSADCSIDDEDAPGQEPAGEVEVGNSFVISEEDYQRLLEPAEPMAVCDECPNEVRVKSNIRWHQQFKELVEFKRANGHVRLPLVYPENQALSNFVSCQRQYKRRGEKGVKNTLSAVRIAKLNAIGFEWTQHRIADREQKLAKQWHARFLELTEFKKEHGHVDIPRLYPAHQKLANWACWQKECYRRMMMGKKHCLSSDRHEKLIAIGFSFESKRSQAEEGPEERKKAIEAEFERNVKKIERFKKKNGHGWVSSGYKDQRLAQFAVRFRRYKREKIEQERHSVLTDKMEARLEEVGFQWAGGLKKRAAPKRKAPPSKRAKRQTREANNDSSSESESSEDDADEEYDEE